MAVSKCSTIAARNFPQEPAACHRQDRGGGRSRQVSANSRLVECCPIELVFGFLKIGSIPE